VQMWKLVKWTALYGFEIWRWMKHLGTGSMDELKIFERYWAARWIISLPVLRWWRSSRLATRFAKLAKIQWRRKIFICWFAWKLIQHTRRLGMELITHVVDVAKNGICKQLNDKSILTHQSKVFIQSFLGLCCTYAL
jgi:hypothetical protein